MSGLHWSPPAGGQQNVGLHCTVCLSAPHAWHNHRPLHYRPVADWEQVTDWEMETGRWGFQGVQTFYAAVIQTIVPRRTENDMPRNTEIYTHLVFQASWWTPVNHSHSELLHLVCRNHVTMSCLWELMEVETGAWGLRSHKSIIKFNSTSCFFSQRL